MYADDIKLYKYIRSLSDCSRLQLAIIAWYHGLINGNCESQSINVWLATSAITVPRLIHIAFRIYLYQMY